MTPFLNLYFCQFNTYHNFAYILKDKTSAPRGRQNPLSIAGAMPGSQEGRRLGPGRGLRARSCRSRLSAGSTAAAGSSRTDRPAEAPEGAMRPNRDNNCPWKYTL